MELIQNKFKCGKIKSDRNAFVLIISSLKDIETIIIPFFDKYPLMTKKYLDFLDFKESFFIFKKRQKDKNSKYEYDLKILNLKNGMNDKRINFAFPKTYKIIITSYWLLGFIEGDGSFYFNKHDNTVRISLVTITKDQILLVKIKEFLYNQLDKNSLFLAKNTKLISIINKNVHNNWKPISILEISQIDYICNYIISFFDHLDFKTKKYLDYLDFRKIAFLIREGKHLTEKGRNLIIKLADSMNNSRLSTNLNKSSIEDTNYKVELELLVKSNPLISIDSEGRALVISENKWIRSTYIIKATLPSGNIEYFPTGVSCAKAFCVSNTTIMKRLNDKKPLINVENKILALSLKRIKVYEKI